MLWLLALLLGVNVVVSRYLNAVYARHNGVAMGAVANYVTGLITALAVLLAIGEPLLAQPLGALTLRKAAMFLGGAVGMVMVQMTIYITPRMPAFLSTLLLFVSQLGTGVALDWVLTGTCSPQKLLGAALVMLGLTHYAWVERTAARRVKVAATPLP